MDDFDPTPEDRFLAWGSTRGNVFLTGQAGTGKSTLLRKLLATPEMRSKTVAICAPTGIAALNIGGTTVHRWSGMMLGPAEGQDHNTFAEELEREPWTKHAIRRVEATDVLVIDEISMMAGSQLDFLDFWLRRCRKDSTPFGGLQVIFLGDFLQLPPVRTDISRPYDWAFNARSWAEADLKTISLEKVHRQSDPAFIEALGAFRTGKMRRQDADLLRSRVSMFPRAEITRLMTHNTQVDKWNAYRLDGIAGEQRVYTAQATGDPKNMEFCLRNMPSPKELVLKHGCAVIFTRNDPEAGFVNGQIGTVVNLGNDSIRVLTQQGQHVDVEMAEWEFDSMKVRISQFPLRLAYAMTIHRAQGLTLDAARIDIRAAREPGQAYVAVSRVRTLAGIHLTEWPKGWFVSEEALAFHAR